MPTNELIDLAITLSAAMPKIGLSEELNRRREVAVRGIGEALDFLYALREEEVSDR